MTTEVEQQQLVEDAIAALDLGGFAVGWLLMVETIDEDGNRTLRRLWDEALTRWAIQGMLHACLHDDASWDD